MPVQIMFILIYAITAAYLLFLTPEHTVIDDESHILKNSLIQFKRIINLCAFLACIILARVFTMSNKQPLTLLEKDSAKYMFSYVVFYPHDLLEIILTFQVLTLAAGSSITTSQLNLQQKNVRLIITLVKVIITHSTFILSFEPANLSFVIISLLILDVIIPITACIFAFSSARKFKSVSRMVQQETKNSHIVSILLKKREKYMKASHLLLGIWLSVQVYESLIYLLLIFDFKRYKTFVNEQ